MLQLIFGTQLGNDIKSNLWKFHEKNPYDKKLSTENTLHKTW